MRTRLVPAVAGLALALVLAFTATSGAGAGDGATDSPDPTAVIAADIGEAPITVPLVEDPIPAREDVDSYRPVPGPTPEEIEAWNAAVEQAEAEKAAAERAAAERAAAEQAAAAQAAAAPAGSVQEIIARYFGPQTSKAMAVARCESGLNPNAMSPGGGNHGLFQINNVHSGHFQSVTGYPWSSRYDAEANTRFAHWLWSQQGWGPWACA